MRVQDRVASRWLSCNWGMRALTVASRWWTHNWGNYGKEKKTTNRPVPSPGSSCKWHRVNTSQLRVDGGVATRAHGPSQLRVDSGLATGWKITRSQVASPRDWLATRKTTTPIDRVATQAGLVTRTKTKGMGPVASGGWT